MAQLYMLEILVENVVFLDEDGVPPEKDVTITITFGNTFTLAIKSNDHTKGRSKPAGNVDFNCGKSHLFSSSPEDLVKLIKKNNLVFELLLRDETVPVAQYVVKWTAEHEKLVQLKSVPKNEAQTVSDSQEGELINAKDKTPVATINYNFRLTNFGTQIQTQFEIATTSEEDQRKYMYKNNNMPTAVKVGGKTPQLPTASKQDVGWEPLFVTKYESRKSFIPSELKFILSSLRVDSEPKDEQTGMSDADLTDDYINKRLCKNPNCPGALKFRDIGLGPLAPRDAFLGVPQGTERPAKTYGISNTYGTMDEYGEYGLLQKKKKPNNYRMSAGRCGDPNTKSNKGSCCQGSQKNSQVSQASRQVTRASDYTDASSQGKKPCPCSTYPCSEDIGEFPYSAEKFCSPQNCKPVGCKCMWDDGNPERDLGMDLQCHPCRMIPKKEDSNGGPKKCPCSNTNTTQEKKPCPCSSPNASSQGKTPCPCSAPKKKPCPCSTNTNGQPKSTCPCNTYPCTEDIGEYPYGPEKFCSPKTCKLVGCRCMWDDGNPERDIGMDIQCHPSRAMPKIEPERQTYNDTKVKARSPRCPVRICRIVEESVSMEDDDCTCEPPEEIPDNFIPFDTPCHLDSCAAYNYPVCEECGGITISGATCLNRDVPFDGIGLRRDPRLVNEEVEAVVVTPVETPKTTGKKKKGDKGKESKKKEKKVRLPKVVETFKGKKTRFIYTVGEYYPGIRVGHRTCVGVPRNVPKLMGWLWDAWDGTTLRTRRGWKPGLLGKTINAMIQKHRKALGLPDLPELTILISKKKPTKRGGYPQEEEEEEEDVEPQATLLIKKRKGNYYITMHPLKDPKMLREREYPYINCTPMEFVIEKPKKPETLSPADQIRAMRPEYTDCLCDEDLAIMNLESEIVSSSSESELDIELTAPAGLIDPVAMRRKPDRVHLQVQYNEADLTDPDCVIMLPRCMKPKKKVKLKG